MKNHPLLRESLLAGLRTTNLEEQQNSQAWIHFPGTFAGLAKSNMAATGGK